MADISLPHVSSDWKPSAATRGSRATGAAASSTMKASAIEQLAAFFQDGRIGAVAKQRVDHLRVAMGSVFTGTNVAQAYIDVLSEQCKACYGVTLKVDWL